METAGYQRYSEEAKLEIRNERTNPIEHGVQILAEVHNAGEFSWNGVNLKAELFNENGEFVYDCTEFARGELEPGGHINVRIQCGGCANSNVPSFDTYDLSILDASSY